MKQLIVIDGEVKEVHEIHSYGQTMLELEDGTEWYIFQDTTAAGEAARAYWEDMAHDDPKEFTCLVGEETLVQWGLEQYAGPGSTKVRSLQDWLDLWLDTPEEHWASYDGQEVECTINGNLQKELGLEHECVCYRHN